MFIPASLFCQCSCHSVNEVLCRLFKLNLTEWITWGRYSFCEKVQLTIKTQKDFVSHSATYIQRWLSLKTCCSSINTWLIVFLCRVSSQGGQWFSWRHAARLGHRDRSVFTRPHGPCGGGALRPVRRAAGGQRCLRLHGQSVGPWDRDLPPHAAGPHQQSVLVTGEQLQTHSVVYSGVWLVGKLPRI